MAIFPNGYNTQNPLHTFFGAIVKKGNTTSTKRTDSEEKKEARKAELIATMEKVIAPTQDRRYAEAQFTGTPSKEEPFKVYLTKIFPSGRYHCQCNAFKRDGAHRQTRPCKHATALARVVLADMGVALEWNDPREAK